MNHKICKIKKNVIKKWRKEYRREVIHVYKPPHRRRYHKKPLDLYEMSDTYWIIPLCIMLAILSLLLDKK